jgi:hypothetical protein
MHQQFWAEWMHLDLFQSQVRAIANTQLDRLADSIQLGDPGTSGSQGASDGNTKSIETQGEPVVPDDSNKSETFLLAVSGKEEGNGVLTSTVEGFTSTDPSNKRGLQQDDTGCLLT